MKRNREYFPQFIFWENLFKDGWKTPPSYGQAKYEELIPESSGVYLFCAIDISFEKVLKEPQILYIGKSLNLKNRAKNHPIIKEICCNLPRHRCLEYWFKSLDEPLIHQEEIRLIKLHHPPYNLAHRVKRVVA